MRTELHGVVTPYAGNGRKLGYPTANIATQTTLQDGVYFGYATMGQYRQHPALIFVGAPITMGDTQRRVEAYLLDAADQDYYGLEIVLNIQYFHRANQKFDSVTELLGAIEKDEAAGRQWFLAAS